MKKSIGFFIGTALLFSCSNPEVARIEVSNSLPVERNEVVEILRTELPPVIQKQGDQFIITNVEGKEIVHQVTYDGKILFSASVPANGQAIYTIKPGIPSTYTTIACGKYYPQRVDDIAWENDRIAFRTYGPALQANGEKAFGYDLWAKRVSEPVVDDRYNKELNEETAKRIAELKQTDPKAAQELYNSVSYHVDHGNGLDYYSVGPTLGAGTAALLQNDSIVYPYCYKTYEILDNGPLRFTVKLVYNPLTIKDNDQVIETRLLSLDAGSQLNKVTVTYDNLNETTPVVTGIVMHEPSDVCKINKEKGFIAYADPADNVNGQLYAGAVVAQPEKVTDAKTSYFPEDEKKFRKANGQLLIQSDYTPGSSYTYYWGGGWSKWGFATPDYWFAYMNSFADRIKSPLRVKIQP